MSDAFAFVERGQAAQAAVNALEEAIQQIEEAIGLFTVAEGVDVTFPGMYS